MEEYAAGGEGGVGSDPLAGSGRLVVCLGTTPTVQRTMVFDALTAGDTNRAVDVYEYASGKGINAARVLHTLGQPAAYVGIVGGDRGAFIRADLERIGLRHELVEVPSRTRLCVTVVDRARRQATELIEEAAGVEASAAGALLEGLASWSREAGPGGVVTLSGSVVPGLGEDFYAEAVRVAREAGCRTILDARGPALTAALAEKPDVVKPNRGELSATIGRPVDSRRTMHEAMSAIIEKGAGWVVVTRGRDGASVADGERFWEVSAPRVDAVSPIGSGDAFAAGLAAGLLVGIGMPEACRLASACGAANALTAHSGHLDPSEVSRRVDDVTVREVG